MKLRNRQITLFLFSIFVFFILPQLTFAQTPKTLCTCFCADSKNGAQDILKEKTTIDKCETACKDKGLRVAVCAKTLRQFPSNNALCFDDKACRKQDGELAKQQASECPKGWSYCFPKPDKTKVKLSTKIGGLEEVGDLGAYVSGVYKWMLGVAGFFAIVMVMIGGLQWVLSSGGAGSIEKAKERMRNGVIGMILLFCVVLILQTINPNLLKLEIPRPSKIRIVDLAANSCEILKRLGYKLKTAEGSQEKCGGMATIVNGPDNTQVADGLTCAYTACEKGGCFARNMNESGKCVECRFVSLDNKSRVASPSKDTCTALSQIKTSSSGYLVQTYCSFQKENAGASFTLGTGLNIPGGLDNDSCMEVEVDCSSIKKCKDYNSLPIYYYDDSMLKKQKLILVDRNMSQMICLDNPCKVDKADCEWSGIFTKDCSAK